MNEQDPRLFLKLGLLTRESVMTLSLDRLSLESSKPCGLWSGWLRPGVPSAKKSPGMDPQNRETVPYGKPVHWDPPGCGWPHPRV